MLAEDFDVYPFIDAAMVWREEGAFGFEKSSWYGSPAARHLSCLGLHMPSPLQAFELNLSGRIIHAHIIDVRGG
jgi:hypothetical protein